MNTWSIYSMATGIFTGGSIMAASEHAAMNTPAGCALIAGVFDHLSQRVDVAATAAAQAAAVPPPFVSGPGGGYQPPTPTIAPIVVSYQPPAPANDTLQTWSWDTPSKRWQSAPTLLSIQLARWETMKLARTAAITAPLTTPYGVFDADADSQAKISGAVQMMQLAASATIAWTLHDNTTITLTAAQLVQVGLLLGSREQSAFATGVSLRAAINAATDIPTVEAITW